MTFKDKNLIEALSNKNNVFDKNWDNIQLWFEKNKLISNENIVNSITRIIIITEYVKNLSWLENFTNLKELVLFNNEIEDITPLKNLSNLTILSLDLNDIKDLSPLTNLKNLTILKLNQNQDLWKLNEDFFSEDNNNITDKWFNINSTWKTIIIKKV